MVNAVIESGGRKISVGYSTEMFQPRSLGGRGSIRYEPFPLHSLCISTRLRSAPEFYLTLSKKDSLSRLWRWTGILKGIDMGVREFDSKYVIKSSDEAAAKRILSNARTRELFSALLAQFERAGVSGGNAYAETPVENAPGTIPAGSAGLLAKLAGEIEKST